MGPSRVIDITLYDASSEKDLERLHRSTNGA